ncbi:MAG: MBL fold metallo-hydrolase [Candidatus Aminicenantes bacterium]|nr:MBL fold metallo-hydrolase [Candidatus Aminicenantes bacterium]
MRRRGISPLQGNVFVIRDPMFPLYVIRGDRNLLIDCSILARAREIEDELERFLGGEKIDQVLLTHSHYDHTGACSHLQEKYGFEIVASQRTKEILASDKAIAFIDGLNQKFKEMLQDRSGLVFSKPHNVRAVMENDVLPLSSSQELEVLETPGHTRCSLSFLLKPENILFPGDAAGVMERNGRIKPLFLSSYMQYEASLKKLMTLNAAVLALPHNSVVRGERAVREFLEASLAETGKLKEKIVCALKRTDDLASIAEDLLDEEYSAPAIMGPREALLLNVTAMVKSVFYEFVKVP